MPNYTFSTILMTILASNLLVVVIAMCFRKLMLMVNAGYKLLAVLIGFIALRLVFPFEAPFAVTIALPDLLSRLIAWIRHPIIKHPMISIWTVCEMIWLVGIIVSCFRRLYFHVRDKHRIILHCLDITGEEPYASLVERICAEEHHKNTFRVWLLPASMVRSPLIYGFFRPRILMPEGLVMTEENLYTVLKHEMMHHFHHDLLTKGIVRLIVIAYWWNPACYVLEKKLDVVLEMRVDALLTQSDPEATAAYLRCLEQIADWAATIEKDSDSNSTPPSMSLLPEEKSDLVKRFQMMYYSDARRKRSLNILLAALMLLIFAFSYCVIFEAYYVTDDVEEVTSDLLSNDTYLIDKFDGTYDVYFQGQLIETIDEASLDYYGYAPIYTEHPTENPEAVGR